MNVSCVSEIKLSGDLCSIDCCENYLALSLRTNIVTVFVLEEYYVNCACSTLILFPDVVRFFNVGYLLCGAGEGDLLVLEILPDSSLIQLKSSQKVHFSTIKEIIAKQDTVFTCGLDNYVNIFQVSKGIKTLNLFQTHSFLAHDGWVVGMSISSQHLLTQGSDNKVRFWDLKSLRKTMEIIYEQEDEPFSILCKPAFKEPYFYLANTKSQVNGNGCLTAVNEASLNIIEVGFEIYVGKARKVLGLGGYGCMVDVQACAVVKEFIVVAVIFGVLLYSQEGFQLVDEFFLPNGHWIVVLGI